MDTMNINDDNTLTRRSLTTPSEWSMTGYSETPSRNGVAWSGVIRRNGVEVGRCADAGRGGMLDFEWTGSQHMHAFAAEEKARYGKQSEPGAMFANDLATAAQYNRKRSVVVITDDCDLSWGDAYVLKSTVTLAQAKAHFTNPANPHAAKNPMIWDKRQSIFVPAADIEV